MIIGKAQLKQLYPNLSEEQYQPAGIDLTLGKVLNLEHNEGTQYGLLKDAKVLPDQHEIESTNVQVAGMLKQVWRLEPNIPYIAVTKEKIKISQNAGQFYLPRSSLLRAGIDVRTAFGDPGFHGHLSFLVINHTDKPFLLEKGVRFAQLVDISANHIEDEYDGDYNE